MKIKNILIAWSLGMFSLLVGASIQDPYTLNFNENTDGATGYRAYYDDGNTGIAIADQKPSDLKQIAEFSKPPFNFTPELIAMRYDKHNACFRVTAYNQYGESDLSDPACKEIAAGVPGKPQGATVDRAAP